MIQMTTLLPFVFPIEKPVTDEDGPKDVDLRTELLPAIAASAAATLNNDQNKRLSEEPIDEPTSKKTKSEKIDM